MRFFNDCSTLEEVKSKYRDLCKANHPDKHPEDPATFTRLMQDINNEYAFAIAKIAKGESLTEDEINTEIVNAEAYRQAINKIINLEGIQIEIVGAWIWVTGNTRQHSELLKSEEGGKFFWASKKLAWYFRTAEYKCHNRRRMDLDEIRSKYGSKIIRNDRRTAGAFLG